MLAKTLDLTSSGRSAGWSQSSAFQTQGVLTFADMSWSESESSNKKKRPNSMKYLMLEVACFNLTNKSVFSINGRMRSYFLHNCVGCWNSFTNQQQQCRVAFVPQSATKGHGFRKNMQGLQNWKFFTLHLCLQDFPGAKNLSIFSRNNLEGQRVPTKGEGVKRPMFFEAYQHPSRGANGKGWTKQPCRIQTPPLGGL